MVFCSAGAGRLSPIGKSTVPKQTMMHCFQVVSANAEEVLDLTVDMEKPLGLSY